MAGDGRRARVDDAMAFYTRGLERNRRRTSMTIPIHSDDVLYLITRRIDDAPQQELFSHLVLLPWLPLRVQPAQHHRPAYNRHASPGGYQRDRRVPPYW